MINKGYSSMNESLKTRTATGKDLKKIKVGDTLYHKDFDGPLKVTEIHKDNSNYTKNFGISGIEVKASDGNKYDLWYDTETLKMQKKVGNGINKLLIPINESNDLSTEDTFINKFKVGKYRLQFSHRKGTNLYQVSQNDSAYIAGFPYAQTRDGGKTWIVRSGPDEIDTFSNITDYMEVAKKLVKIYEENKNESASEINESNQNAEISKMNRQLEYDLITTNDKGDLCIDVDGEYMDAKQATKFLKNLEKAIKMIS